MGVSISQKTLATASLLGRQGSTWKVEGSGMATISDSSARVRPSTEAPSKLAPFRNTPSSSSTVMANPFRVPKISVNQRRMNLTSLSRADSKTYFMASSSMFLLGFSVLCGMVLNVQMSLMSHVLKVDLHDRYSNRLGIEY